MIFYRNKKTAVFSGSRQTNHKRKLSATRQKTTGGV